MNDIKVHIIYTLKIFFFHSLIKEEGYIKLRKFINPMNVVFIFGAFFSYGYALHFSHLNAVKNKTKTNTMLSDDCIVRNN